VASVQVRYIVHDVDAAIAFYTTHLGFILEMHPAPAFAMLSRGELRLVLSAPNAQAGGGQAMPDGSRPEPGGWNRFAILVDDLEATVARLRSAGAHFRNDVVVGVGGKQILLDDPSGNPVELFEPTRREARLGDSTMLRCTPFLLFDGNCAEAMRFYHECLGGELVLTKLGDTPMKDQFPPEKHGRIINARIESGLIQISATDWMASPAFQPKLGNMSAVYVTGTDATELKTVFDRLAVGAEQERFQPLHEMPFGTYGQFYDRFGVQWIFRGGAT
jgi:PhnB protein